MTPKPVELSTARADLHMHSTASDGTLTPADLVRQASRRGLSLIALTDHDTTAGLTEAIATGAEVGLHVIPGIEFSTDVTAGEVHILGYGIDPASEPLQAALTGFRQARLDRARRMLARLRALGVDLPDDSVQASASDASLGRPHIARAMIAAGCVSSVGEAFDRYLGNGRPAYIENEQRPTPVEAIQLILSAGGLPVHAHPLSSDEFPASLPALIDAGLAGIEVYYGEYSHEQRQQLAQIAAADGLLATGGSDYHGEHFKEGRELGSVLLPAADLRRFLDRLSVERSH